ncbi:MFS transporter [Streptomyces albipurpureus]|uniref:MFS transporter n=1 Tax=Streptomyces albipurpureus TaxID=2897419 RepID=A0ABT0UWE1_9ACTN|nr:MFS transporter [Streptomyces sp. CWNU-1]MCM2392259.1 MFS transporter [Streptomyces sp. CWNU-1]
MPAADDVADAPTPHASQQPRRGPLSYVLAANAVSITGNSLTLVGVPWFALETTGSPAKAGLVAFCATLPVVVSAIAGGPAIDRMGRRRVSIASDAVCAAAIAAIPLLRYAGLLQFWMLCALMAVTGLCHAPGETARYVLVPDLARIAGTPLARAASLFDAVSRGARMAGAALAGVLIALTGAEAVLLLDGLTFAGSALLVFFGVRNVASAEPRKDTAPVSLRAYAGELREGYAFLARNRLLLAMTVLVMCTNGLDQAWSAVLLPVHAKDNLGGAGELGMLVALFAGSALVGALLYGAVGDRFPRRAVFTVAFLLAGAPKFTVAALVDGTVPLAVTMALGGLAAGMLNPILTTLMYERVPDELRSRVAGVTVAGALLTTPLGGLAAGFLIEQTDLLLALLTLGGLYFAATLAPAIFPCWRQLNARPAGQLSTTAPSPRHPTPEGTPPRPSES